MKMTLFGCVLGAMLAAAILLMIHLIDDTVKTPDDVENYLGLSVLGAIPILKEEKGNGKSRR